MDSKTNNNAIVNLLENIYLGGLITECVLDINKNVLSIEAVDKGNSIYVSAKCNASFSIKSDTLGLSDINILLKYFKMVGNNDIVISRIQERLNIKWKGHGIFKYLLTEPDSIESIVKDDEALISFKKLKTHTLIVKQSVVQQLLSYLSLTKSTLVRFRIMNADKNRVRISSDSEGEHNFSMIAGITSTKKTNDISVVVLADNLIPILDVLKFEGDSKQVTFGFGQKRPLIIQQNENLWAVMPLMEE
jgi:hypothetical protein